MTGTQLSVRDLEILLALLRPTPLGYSLVAGFIPAPYTIPLSPLWFL